MRIAVLGGGRSGEHEVSRTSAAAVAGALQGAGHDVVRVDLHQDGTWTCDGDEVVLRAGRGLLGADVVFPVLHGPYGEDGTVQGLLELLDVPYVGAGVLASALCMDKVAFKDVMAQHGIAQVGYALLTRGDPFPEHLGWPCWVKPARLGSSVGIVKVRGPEDVDAALAEAFGWDERVIVEGHCDGIEVECSVLGPAHAPEVSQPGEIVIDREWYDYEAKYTPGGMRLQVPARISVAATAELRELAARAYRAAGCAGLARADFFVAGDDVLLNELNTMPGQTPTSVYGKLWELSGVPYVQVLERLCALAVER